MGGQVGGPDDQLLGMKVLIPYLVFDTTLMGMLGSSLQPQEGGGRLGSHFSFAGMGGDTVFSVVFGWSREVIV